MAKIRFENMSPAVANLLGIILALIVGLVFSLPWGIGYAIDWVTNLALYSVIIEVAIDFVGKLKEKDHPRLCWEYLVVIAIALYDLVHGAIKEWKARQSIKKEEK